MLDKYEWKGNQEELLSNLSDGEGRISSQQSNHNQFRGRTRGRGEGRGGRRGKERDRTQISRNSNAGVNNVSDTHSTRNRGNHSNHSNHNRKNAYTRKMNKGFGRSPE